MVKLAFGGKATIGELVEALVLDLGKYLYIIGSY